MFKQLHFFTKYSDFQGGIGVVASETDRYREKQHYFLRSRPLGGQRVRVSSSDHLPATTAHVRITHQSWHSGRIEGDVSANEFEWHFHWRFRQGQLTVEPSLGRALIQEPLGRFLEQFDYQLEPGGDYSFTIRADL